MNFGFQVSIWSRKYVTIPKEKHRLTLKTKRMDDALKPALHFPTKQFLVGPVQNALRNH